MLTLMTFKYYFVSVVLAIIYQFSQVNLSVSRKYLLFITNLIIITLVFYVSKKHFIFLTAHVTVSTFLCHLLRNEKRSKFLSISALFFCFTPLFLFKFSIPQSFVLNFFPLSSALLKPATFIGISFYTFRMASVLIDILYGKIKEKIGFIELFNFTLFFPCLLSGPLDRFSRFNSEVQSTASVNWEQRYNAIYRIVWGVFKKIVIADVLWNFSNDSYNSIELFQLPTIKILIGQYAYYLMLYFDFSGYCDVAIGLSQMLGISTPENFSSPWKARNIQVFWNKWHITFMNWLRDYIFFPLQIFLHRSGVSNTLINNSLSYILVFLLAGLWHGEDTHFLYYGLYHGLGFTIYFAYKRLLDVGLNKEQKAWYIKSKSVEVLSTIITFHFFLISLFFFIDKQIAIKILFKRLFT